MISFLFWIASAVLLYRLVGAVVERQELRRLRTEEFEKWQRLSQRDPNNASAWANMASHYAENGDLERAVENYRRAINLMPHGPFSPKWKRALKTILRRQEALARGENPVSVDHQLECDNCFQLVPATSKKCPKCGHVLNMNIAEYLSQPDVAREWARESLIAAAVAILVLWIGGLLFTGLPLEWKGTLIIASVMVGGWYFLRFIQDGRV